jgi:hypothetical protein
MVHFLPNFPWFEQRSWHDSCIVVMHLSAVRSLSAVFSRTYRFSAHIALLAGVCVCVHECWLIGMFVCV